MRIKWVFLLLFIMIGQGYCQSIGSNQTPGFPPMPLFGDYSQSFHLTESALADNMIAEASPYAGTPAVSLQYSAIDLTGNGDYYLNWTKFGTQLNFNSSMKIIFPWIDFGPEADATYVGVQMYLENGGQIYYLNLMDHYVGSYPNATNAINLQSSVSSPSDTSRWGMYGVDFADVLPLFGVQSLTLTDIKLIIAASASFNGPRRVVFGEPIIGTTFMPIYNGSVGNSFKGYYDGTYNPPVAPPSIYPEMPLFGDYSQILSVIPHALAGDMVAEPSPYAGTPIVDLSNSVIDMTGNGDYSLNWTEYGNQLVFDSSMKFIFPWIDYGPEPDATYVGMQLYLESGDQIYYLNLMDHYAGSYPNATNAINLQSSVSSPSDTSKWGMYGVDFADVLPLFGVQSLTLTGIKLIIGGSISYNGPRRVVFGEPIAGTTGLPAYTGTTGNSFKGYYDGTYNPPSTSSHPSLTTQTRPPITFSKISSTSDTTIESITPTPVGLPFALIGMIAFFVVMPIIIRNIRNKK